MKSLNFLLLLFSLILIRSTIKVTLNSSPEVIITYSFPQSDTIRITLEANSQGFIGLGFGSQMAGTNIILLYKENGNFVAKDTTASGHVVPTSHTIQNVVLIEGTRNTSWTTATFERKLNTGASEDYTITPFSPTPLIWALGSSDTLIKHVNYGSTIHTFLQCDSSCLTCSGPLASNCASCESGKTLNNSQCSLICDASCLTCDSTSSTKCTSCDSSHELIGEACVALTCDSTCLTCSGTTANNCSSCANGKYLAADLSCLACHSACLTCSGGLYNQCLSCNTSLYSLNNDGGCVIPYTTCSLVNGSSCFSYRLSSNPVLNINYSLPTSDSIQITMEYYTQGFIAMGFGESMSSADVILANMTNSIMNLSDRTATRRGLPSLDPVQSAQLLSSYRTTEKTVITYLRKLDTNQVNNTVIALSKTTPLIWSYGTSDTLSYHGNTRRGATFVSFFPCHFSCKTCQGSLSSDCLSCNEDLRIMNEGSCVLINTLWGVGWYSVVLNQTPLIRLNYSYISAEKLSFTMEYHTQGFISLGFGYNMSQADIALSYMVNGTGFLQDSYSNKRSKPTADAIQNLELKYWARDSSKTVVNFQRALNTGEADDYFLKANITTPIIWAYGSTDTVSYHMTNRGKTFIAFQQTTIGKSCTSNCKDCYGPQADQCVSCMSGYFLTNNQCLACDSTCSECSGPGNNQCITCSVQNRIPSNGTCVATISSIKLNDIPLIYLNYSFPESNKIEIMLEFHTQGYIAIGFGNTMSNSDMILAYKSNDQFVVRSARASGNVEPVENSVQNMNITSSSRDSEKTIVTFQRKLSYERLLQSSTTSLVTLNINTDIPLIWSYGSSDTLELHVKEGERIIQFQQIKCDISCLTCSGSSNNQCTSCNSSSELINGICQQYKCDSSCLTCFGNGTNECLSCASQRFLENGRCVSSISELLNDLNSDLEVTNQFYMYWKFNSNNTVTIALRWNTGGYIALGFGKSMDGMDIISTEYQNGILKVYDRWASSESSPPTDSALGGKDDLTLISSVNSDSQGFAIVKFNRALNTNDSYDYIIKQQTEEFCFAFTSDKTINFHGSNVRVFSFDFVDGFKGKANLENPDKSTLVQAHGIGLLICWSFLVDVSIMIIRYFKHIKNYVEIHATMFFIIDIFTLIIVFMMIAKSNFLFYLYD